MGCVFFKKKVRIIICFIESKNKTGSYDLNPFDFQRSWTVTSSVTSSTDSQLSDRERYLERKLLDFEKQLLYFKSCVTLVSPETSTDPQNKGKGRGKKSKPSEDSNSTSQGLLNRLRSSFSGPLHDTQSEAGASSSHHSDASVSGTPSLPPPYAEVGATTKTVYIKQVQLLLNGTPLDQIDCLETGKF